MTQVYFSLSRINTGNFKSGSSCLLFDESLFSDEGYEVNEPLY